MILHPPSTVHVLGRGRCVHIGKGAKSQLLVFLKPMEQATLIWKLYNPEVAQAAQVCFVLVGCPLESLFKLGLIATIKIRNFHMEFQRTRTKRACTSL